jgi:hypothetical protein
MLGGDFGTVAKYFARNLRLPFTLLWSSFPVLHYLNSSESTIISLWQEAKK